MKRIYFIGGPMGVGKTTISQVLKKKLDKSVFLDGDWCWDSNPFIVNDETKKIVIDNICYLLNNYIKSLSYQNIIFCWVLDYQNIIDDILLRLTKDNYEVIVISLISSKMVLTERLTKDVNMGLRKKDIIEKSIARLPLYQDVNSIKIDTSNKTIDEIVNAIIKVG